MSEPAADAEPRRASSPPSYKGAPLDSERGPGLGCFWIQIVLLVVLLVATPVSVWLQAPPWFSALLLIMSLGLLFFAGQTTIFLLRLVAADRRAQRRPLREGARPTVGQLGRQGTEEAADAAEPTRGVESDQDDA